MVTTLGRLKAIDSIDQLVKAPPTQTYSSGGKLPPPPRPTYQGPNDEDPLRHTVPLVPGMQQQALTKGYSPHSSERPLYERN